MLDELIVAGGENAFVEELVGAVVIGAAVDRALEGVVSQLHRFDLVQRRPLTCPAHGHRFDGAAQVKQVIDKIFRQAVARQPTDHLRIEQVPAPHRQHAGADFRPDFEHAFGDEGFDCFANNRATDAELFTQIGLDLDGLPRLDLASGDPAAQPVDRGCVKAAGHEHLKAGRDG